MSVVDGAFLPCNGTLVVRKLEKDRHESGLIVVEYSKEEEVYSGILISMSDDSFIGKPEYGVGDIVVFDEYLSYEDLMLVHHTSVLGYRSIG